MLNGPMDQTTDQKRKGRGKFTPEGSQNLAKQGRQAQNGDAMKCGPMDQATDKKGKERKERTLQGGQNPVKTRASGTNAWQKVEAGMFRTTVQAMDKRGKARRKREIGRGAKPRQNKGPRPKSATKAYLGPWNTPRSKRGMERNKGRWERAKNP